MLISVSVKKSNDHRKQRTLLNNNKKRSVFSNNYFCKSFENYDFRERKEHGHRC